MPEPQIPRWQTGAVVASVILASVIVLGLSGGPAPFPCVGAPPGGECGATLTRSNLTYATEDILVPTSGAGGSPVTQVSYQGVFFRMWPEHLSEGPPDLQGTGTEPNGVGLAFILLSSNLSTGGNPPPTNATVRTWFSPDGVFGAAWLALIGDSIEVQVAVTEPLLQFRAESVTLPPIGTGGMDSRTSFAFEGAAFSIQIVDWYSPAGPALNATVLEISGALVGLALWAGPLVACSVSGDTPPGILNNASCLESAAPDHGVALVWDGFLQVTLLVRGVVTAPS
ncbi:MAG TPA: hypothetical protein VFG07_08845 [Thermoplasmata archaeon]|nr:hypothetical protein [Thermoplasmata archaeon]